MNIRLKLPYNFSYSEELVSYLENHAGLIDSIYFSFSKGSRPLKSLQHNHYFHMKNLERIKERLHVKLNFVLNFVIPVEITELDYFILESGLLDIVTIAMDDTYITVREHMERKYLDIKYEASRFYNYIQDNKGVLKQEADILTYGFEHELPLKKQEGQQLCFIANERCYDKYEFKIQHNTNVMQRNLGLTTEKFSCPYKEKREIYSHEKVNGICRNYQVDLLKFCDRTMTDQELLDIFQSWFPYIKSNMNDE